MGVANDRSIAWGISKKLAEHGAELAFTYLGDALKKRDMPLVVNASIIAAGISNSIDLFCSTKIFLIAGSNSHAIDAVPPATPKDKKSAIIILNTCFFKVSN